MQTTTTSLFEEPQSEHPGSTKPAITNDKTEKNDLAFRYDILIFFIPLFLPKRPAF